MSEFSIRARAALQARGMSLRAVARELNFDAAYVCRVLNGKQRPSPKLAHDLDRLLGAEGALAELAETLTADDRARLARSIAAPSRTDAATVKALADVLAAQRRLDDVLPAAAMLPATAAQWATVEKLAREIRGPYVKELHLIAAEWVQFLGWLHAETGNGQEALRYLTKAEEFADEIGDGPLAAQAANFKGYLARRYGRPRAIVRWFLTAYHTPGATSLQRVNDAVQAAHGYALLGQHNEARWLLDEAADLTDSAAGQKPPGTAYWLSPTFSRLGIGLALLALDRPAEAADHLRAGLDGLPGDQHGAEWTYEYREALARAGRAV